MPHKPRANCLTWRVTTPTKHWMVTNFRSNLTNLTRLTIKTSWTYKPMSNNQIHLHRWIKVKTRTDFNQYSSRKAISIRKPSNYHLNLKLVEQTRLETQSISMTCSSRSILRKSLPLWHQRKSSAQMINQTPQLALGSRTSPHNMTTSRKVVNLMGAQSLIQEDHLKRNKWSQKWFSRMICHTFKYL